MYKSGTWWSLCAVCGFQYRSDELKERWDGVKVCDKDWEPRNVLDFFKARPETGQSVPWSQPDNDGGELTSTTKDNSFSIAPSLTDLNFLYYNPPGGAGVVATLPTANNSVFMGSSLIYTITLTSDSDPIILTNNGAAVSPFPITLTAGQTIRLQNLPTTAKGWVIIAYG